MNIIKASDFLNMAYVSDNQAIGVGWTYLAHLSIAVYFYDEDQTEAELLGLQNDDPSTARSEITQTIAALMVERALDDYKGVYSELAPIVRSSIESSMVDSRVEEARRLIDRADETVYTFFSKYAAMHNLSGDMSAVERISENLKKNLTPVLNVDTLSVN